MVRKSLFILGMALCGALVAVPAGAMTSGAHFFKDTGASVGPTAQLIVHIDEAGVGNTNVNYSISWTGTAVWECINGGTKHPKASNKETVVASGTSSLSLQPRNGRVTATVPVATTPPGPGTFKCPSGQTLVLASVTYSVTVHDTTNGVSAGPFTASGS